MDGYLTEGRMYDIVVRHDGRYDGVFCFGARDSGIYCVPSGRGAPARPYGRRAAADGGRSEAEAP